MKNQRILSKFFINKSSNENNVKSIKAALRTNNTFKQQQNSFASFAQTINSPAKVHSGGFSHSLSSQDTPKYQQGQSIYPNSNKNTHFFNPTLKSTNLTLNEPENSSGQINADNLVVIKEENEGGSSPTKLNLYLNSQPGIYLDMTNRLRIDWNLIRNGINLIESNSHSLGERTPSFSSLIASKRHETDPISLPKSLFTRIAQLSQSSSKFLL